MTSTLFIVQIVLAILITIAVLLQKSSSIGLGAYSGSNESLFGAKGPAGFLTKITFILGLLFVANTLTLGYLYSKDSKSSAVDTVKTIDKVIPAASTEGNSTSANIDSNKTKADATKALEVNTTTANTAVSKVDDTNATKSSAVTSTTTSEANTTIVDTNTTATTSEANTTAADTTTTVIDATNEDKNSTTSDTSTAAADVNATANSNTEATETNSSSDTNTSDATAIDAPVVIDEKKEEAAIIADINSENASTKPHILKGVYFKTASSELSNKSERQLEVLASTLKAHSSVKIKLRGHTDNTGAKDMNLKLSASRAKAVKESLVKRGIDASRIEIEGKASEEPIASNKNKEGRVSNRRVDVAVVK